MKEIFSTLIFLMIILSSHAQDVIDQKLIIKGQFKNFDSTQLSSFYSNNTYKDYNGYIAKLSNEGELNIYKSNSRHFFPIIIVGEHQFSAYCPTYDILNIKADYNNFKNTLQFDGTYAKQNVALQKINKHNQLFYKFREYEHYKRDTQSFIKLRDSIKNIKADYLKSIYPHEDDFYTIQNQEIAFEYYSALENYYQIQKEELNPNKVFATDYFDFRKQINFDDPLLLQSWYFNEYILTYYHGYMLKKDTLKKVLLDISERFKTPIVRDYVFIHTTNSLVTYDNIYILKDLYDTIKHKNLYSGMITYFYHNYERLHNVRKGVSFMNYQFKNTKQQTVLLSNYKSERCYLFYYKALETLEEYFPDLIKLREQIPNLKIITFTNTPLDPEIANYKYSDISHLSIDFEHDINYNLNYAFELFASGNNPYGILMNPNNTILHPQAPLPEFLEEIKVIIDQSQ